MLNWPISYVTFLDSWCIHEISTVANGLGPSQEQVSQEATKHGRIEEGNPGFFFDLDAQS